VLRPDLDLDWGRYDGLLSLVPGLRGTLEPAGPRLGVEAIGEAVLVFVPGLAADRAGHRLGRGGGSYDRALRRISPTALVAVVLYDEELLDEVPVASHDATVHAVLTPSGLTPVGNPGEPEDSDGYGESW
jgi:5-formyltetrahydrofolate cyclo-ligase